MEAYTALVEYARALPLIPAVTEHNQRAVYRALGEGPSGCAIVALIATICFPCETPAMIELPILGRGVVIDRLVFGDAPSLSASHSDPENARYQGWQSPLSESEARAFIETMLEVEPLADGGGIQLAIREAIGGPLVGDLYLVRAVDPPEAVEVGITLLHSFQRRGLATAAIRAVVAAVHGTGTSGRRVHRIVGVVDVGNLRSQALFERLGFRLEAQQKLIGRRRDGTVADQLVYVLADAAASAGGTR